MTLFSRSCHVQNDRFTLSCAGSVFRGTELMPYFVNSTSLVSISVIKRYNRVNFRIKVNLGQSAISMLLWPEVKFSTWPSEVEKYMLRCVLKRETRWCLNYSAIILSSKVICEKTVNPQIFFTLTRPGGVNIWPKKGQLWYHWTQNVPRICLLLVPQFYLN